MPDVHERRSFGDAACAAATLLTPARDSYSSAIFATHWKNGEARISGKTKCVFAVPRCDCAMQGRRCCSSDPAADGRGTGKGVRGVAIKLLTSPSNAFTEPGPANEARGVGETGSKFRAERERADGGDNCGTAASPRYDKELVASCLEEAGATLLALPLSGPRTNLRTSAWPVVHAAVEAYGWSGARLRPAVPPAAAISRMDEVLSWIQLIPQENYVLRRIVGARALVSPLTGRHLFSWRRLGKLLGADARAVQRWHEKGLSLIALHLNAAKE